MNVNSKNNSRILIIGASGLVGSRYIQLSNLKLLTPDFYELNIRNKKQVEHYISEHKPSVIINFAAFTNVNEAEEQHRDKSSDCWELNVTGVKNIIAALKGSNSHLIQISTDMVFSGDISNPGPYTEDAEPEIDSSKVTWYGYTKAEAERIVLAEIPQQSTIVRIVYPVRASFDAKSDFLRWPLKLFDEGKLYPMFTDQQVSITFVDELCLALKKIVNRKYTGIFHVASSRVTTPYEIVSYLVKKARGKTGVVKRGSLKKFLESYNNPVRYPEKGGLSVKQTQNKLGIKFSNPKEIVDQLIEQGLGGNVK